MKRFHLIEFAVLTQLLCAAQCTPPSSAPAPDPSHAAGAAPTPQPDVIPAAGDRCSAAFTRIIAMDCGLPDTWLDACVTARSHGATFNLFCFDNAKDCKTVSGCMGGP